MRKIFGASGVALAGLITSLLTAIVVAAVDYSTGINIFTFALWFIIPVGALVCGCAAASGYYFGAKYLQQRPTRILLVQMVLIATFTQILIYWFEYKSLVIDGAHVDQFIPFWRYVDVSLTSARLTVSHMPGFPSPEIGSLGYVLAVLDLIGFQVGGWYVYIMLGDQPTCGKCNKYFGSTLVKKHTFEDWDAFYPYYDAVYEHPIDTPEFSRHVSEEHSVKRGGQGTVRIATSVLECPQCHDQFVSEIVKVHRGKDYEEETGLRRLVAIPAGVDIRPAFK